MTTPSSIEALHEQAFGFVPDKPGVAYERITAVVLAVMGWENVQHDVRAGREGRRARHQIDVVATNPEGSAHRLIVECKDWNRTVGKNTVDAVVGVRDQLGADAAAIITTAGFTSGAIDVADDEGIARLVVQAYDPVAHPGPYAMRVVLQVRPEAVRHIDFDATLADPERLTGDVVHLEFDTHGYFLSADGARVEQVLEILKRPTEATRVGEQTRRCRFECPSGWFLPAADGQFAEISALSWTEAIIKGQPFEIVSEANGQPVLAVEEFSAGDESSGRVVVDADLFAWDIGDGGQVAARGKLAA